MLTMIRTSSVKSFTVIVACFLVVGALALVVAPAPFVPHVVASCGGCGAEMPCPEGQYCCDGTCQECPCDPPSCCGVDCICP